MNLPPLVTGAASTIGPIFPPSIPMVLIGGITGISVGKLFVGGVIPGVFMALYLMAMVYYLAKKRNYPKSERATFKELAKSFFISIPALSAPVIIIGGMVSGIFTPNEAGVVACFYSMAIAFFVYRDLDLSKVFSELVSTAIYTSKIMFIVGCAYALAWVFSREQMGIYLTKLLDFGFNRPDNHPIADRRCLPDRRMFLEPIRSDHYFYSSLNAGGE